MAKRTVPNLALVRPGAQRTLTPLGPLDPIGRALFDVAEFTFDDPGSTEILYQACCARSRAERCRQIIDRDGELVFTRSTARAHPLLREETQCRALLARLLGKLGLDLEPIKSPGRPPGS
jgi:hypothetical protein